MQVLPPVPDYWRQASFHQRHARFYRRHASSIPFMSVVEPCLSPIVSDRQWQNLHIGGKIWSHTQPSTSDMQDLYTVINRIIVCTVTVVRNTLNSRVVRATTWSLHNLQQDGQYTINSKMVPTLRTTRWSPHYQQQDGSYTTNSKMVSTLPTARWSLHNLKQDGPSTA